MIRAAEGAGARVAIGGRASTGPGLDEGYFVGPTVLVDVDPALPIERQEVFGPVLCIIPFDDESQALELQNDSDYGLASGVGTHTLRRAHRMARQNAEEREEERTVGKECIITCILRLVLAI